MAVDEMHFREQHAAISCAGCSESFVPKRPWQRFHSAACRNAYHAEHGHQGKVKGVRRLKRGWSIVIHADDDAGFEIGAVVRLVRA